MTADTGRDAHSHDHAMNWTHLEVSVHAVMLMQELQGLHHIACNSANQRLILPNTCNTVPWP